MAHHSFATCQLVHDVARSCHLVRRQDHLVFALVRNTTEASDVSVAVEENFFDVVFQLEIGLFWFFPLQDRIESTGRAAGIENIQWPDEMPSHGDVMRLHVEDEIVRLQGRNRGGIVQFGGVKPEEAPEHAVHGSKARGHSTCHTKELPAVDA